MPWRLFKKERKKKHSKVPQSKDRELTNELALREKSEVIRTEGLPRGQHGGGRRRPNRELVREPQEVEGVGRSLARGPEWPQCEDSLGTVLTKCP